MTATTANDTPVRKRRRAGLRARFTSDQGAVGTEMAIVVAVVVTIALAIGAIMANAAQDYGECIPEPGSESSCDFAD